LNLLKNTQNITIVMEIYLFESIPVTQTTSDKSSVITVEDSFTKPTSEPTTSTVEEEEVTETPGKPTQKVRI